jgi:hypothetical protein
VAHAFTGGADRWFCGLCPTIWWLAAAKEPEIEVSVRLLYPFPSTQMLDFISSFSIVVKLVFFICALFELV